MVLWCTQWLPVFIIWTNSLISGVTNSPVIAGSCRPSKQGNLLSRDIWPAGISESHNQVAFLKMWFLASWKRVKVELSWSWIWNHDFGSGEMSWCHDVMTAGELLAWLLVVWFFLFVWLFARLAGWCWWLLVDYHWLGWSVFVGLVSLWMLDWLVANSLPDWFLAWLNAPCWLSVGLASWCLLGGGH